jgi:hypothetical protein
VVANAENYKDYLMDEHLELVAALLELLKLTKRRNVATRNLTDHSFYFWDH